MLIGQVHQDTIFFEDFNSDLNDPQVGFQDDAVML